MRDIPRDAGVVRHLRQRIGPAIDWTVDALGQPTTRVLPPERVGTIPQPIETVESVLRDGGFRWDPLSLYHYGPDGEDADGSWAYRPSQLADRQLHVVLITDGSDATEVYAHDEFNCLRHPVKHVNEIDIRRREGRAEMRRWLDARGLTYDHD